MNITELGRIVDYLFDKVAPKYPEMLPEDVYGVIYNNVKRNGIKDRDYIDVLSEMKHFEYSHYSVVDFKRNKVIGVRDTYKKAADFKQELETSDNYYKGKLKVVPTIPGAVKRGDKLHTRFITKEIIEENII